ncbi:MAG: metallophosphoesterase [Chloroflexi bacterium]|nr:metallophosphoesterase [Chloroflexota bacterium]
MADNGRTRRRVLHTADVHVISVGDKACHSLEALISLAIKTNVDLVIIAGDLFDYNRVGDDLVRFVAEQFQRLPMPVVVLAGNHDCLAADSVFGRTGLWEKCTNMLIFRAPQGEIFDLPALGIRLWGKPIATYENDVYPMVGIPKPEEDGHWNIAVAHGHYVGDGPPLFPSYHIKKQEIIGSGWDYVALGHHPVFECVDTAPVVACYAGSPSLSGNVVIVDFAEDTGVQISRHSIWESQEGLI